MIKYVYGYRVGNENINARIKRIESDTNLSRARITDANAQNAVWGEFI